MDIKEQLNHAIGIALEKALNSGIKFTKWERLCSNLWRLSVNFTDFLVFNLPEERVNKDFMIVLTRIEEMVNEALA